MHPDTLYFDFAATALDEATAAAMIDPANFQKGQDARKDVLEACEFLTNKLTADFSATPNSNYRCISSMTARLLFLACFYPQEYQYLIHEIAPVDATSIKTRAGLIFIRCLVGSLCDDHNYVLDRNKIRMDYAAGRFIRGLNPLTMNEFLKEILRKLE